MTEVAVLRAVEEGLMLPLMEEFYTIQGEGFHTGRAAYFIRLGGCDVGCHWCDVKESWDRARHPPTPIEPIVRNAKKYADTVVITGGEPLTWNMNFLTQALRKAGLIIHLETSGSYPFSGYWDWVCLSPKKNNTPLESASVKADELKVIVYNRDDFSFAEEQAQRVSSDCLLYLQPEWSRREKMTPEIVAYVMQHPKWRISLQTHKYLNIP